MTIAHRGRIYVVHSEGDLFALVVELQLLRNGPFVYGRRHATRALALQEAAVAKQQYEADGWIEKGS